MTRAGIARSAFGICCVAGIAALIRLLGGTDVEPDATTSDGRANGSPALARSVAAPAVADAPARPSEKPAERSEVAPRDGEPAPDATDTSMSSRRFAIVRVVDGEGRPAPHAPLRVRCDAGAERAGNSMLQSTGDDGVYAFPEVTFAQTFGAIETGSAGPEASFTFELEIPAQDRGRKSVPWSLLFEDPIEIVLPPLGALDVVLTRNGRPFEKPANVKLTVAYDSNPGALGFGIEPLRAQTENGIARFDYVALGARYWPVADCDGGSFTTRLAVEGPTAAGERITTTLEIEALPYVTFRLLDPQGAPVASRSLTLLKMERNPTGPSFALADNVTSDSTGRCEMRWVEPFPAGGHRTLVVDVEATPDDPPAAARVEIDHAFEPGRNDLGDLRLVARPLLVGGAVVDPLGNPVAGARVEATPEEDAAASTAGQLGGIRWRSGSDTVDTDAFGKFAIHADDPASRCTVVAHASGFGESESLRVASGRNDVVLKLRRGARLVASVILPDDLAAGDVTASLVPSDSADARELANVRFGNHPRFPRATCDANGELVFADLAPGAYDFALDVGPLAPALRVTRLAVVEGETLRDPRLQGIDLRPRLKALEIEVVDPAGQPIANAEVVAISGETQAKGREIRAGTFRVLAEPAGQTIQARAPGRRPERREGVRANLRIVLQPAIPITIRARGDAPLAKGEKSLLVQVSPGEAPAADDPDAELRLPRSGETRRFGADRTASFELEGPGKYVVEFQAMRTSANLAISTTVGAPIEIEVRESSTPQTFDVDPPAGALDENW